VSTSVNGEETGSSAFSEGAMEVGIDVKEEVTFSKKSKGRPRKQKVETPPPEVEDAEEDEEGDESGSDV